jgi:predicted RNase H-like nuclease (RuvC/YqgF family)
MNFFMIFFRKLFGKKNKTPEPNAIGQRAEQFVELQAEPVTEPQTDPVLQGKPVIPEPARVKPGVTSTADADEKKLMRRIKELEDDLEDAQDDVKDANKKLDRIRAEKKILKEELDLLQAEHNRIKNEHDTIKNEHAYTVKDLELKKNPVILLTKF